MSFKGLILPIFDFSFFSLFSDFELLFFSLLLEFELESFFISLFSDLLYSLLYQKNVNKQLKAVCFENSKISREKWQVKFNNQISQSLYNLFDFDLNEDLSRYYPQISDSSIKGNFIDIDENCIGFEPTSIPSSTIDLFVYTENIREIYKLSS